MQHSNIPLIETIAQGFGDLLHDIVFVGGSITEVYATDNAASDIRPTTDVDCVYTASTYLRFESFENILRKKGFTNDLESGVICRWKYKDVSVDIMPASEEVLGFSNEWYKEGIRHKLHIFINDALKINILPVTYFLATKIAAIKGRGGEDLRLSHDFEDIIFILNNRAEIYKEIEHEKNNKLKTYISKWAHEMLSRRNIHEEIECMLPFNEYERVNEIIELINRVSILV